MSLDPGAVHVRLTLSAASPRILAVAVDCRRPQAAMVLVGKPPTVAEQLVPLLFTVCGKAQGLAASLAIRAAQGETLAPRNHQEAAREAAREHLWHLLGNDRRDLLAAGTRCLQEDDPAAALADFLAPLLGMTARDWLAMTTTQALESWADSGDTALTKGFRPGAEEPPRAATALLPVLDAEASLDFWPRLQGDFCARPHWQGRAAETGALARQGQAPLIAALAEQPWRQRKAARLRELLLFADKDTEAALPGLASAQPLAPGCGRALVETARGLLMHEVTVRDGLIADYQLAAPTEWNFHPQGPFAAWLTGRLGVSREDLKEAAAAAVAALDPCVAWTLDFQTADPS